MVLQWGRNWIWSSLYYIIVIVTVEHIVTEREERVERKLRYDREGTDEENEWRTGQSRGTASGRVEKSCWQTGGFRENEKRPMGWSENEKNQSKN